MKNVRQASTVGREERSASEPLEPLLDRLQFALTLARLGDWSWDASSGRATLSKRALEIFGLDTTDIAWDALRQRIHPEEREAERTAVESALGNHSDYDMEYRVASGSGWRWVQAQGRPFHDAAGRLLGMHGVVQDISSRKWVEEEIHATNEALLRANRELEEFAFVASHDLQEPLRMVNLYSQLLSRKAASSEDEETRRYSAVIRSGVERMESLIRDLLAFSRALHGEPDLKALPLEECLQSVLTVMEDRIREAGATVVAKALPTVLGVRLQLEQVLQNLLSNALKYRRTEVPLEIRISAAGQPGDWVIAVADNGIGFEPKYAQRIFGLFKRLHGEKYPGTGLGLAICQRIIDRHGGRIWAESETGRGTTVYFTLQAP